MLNLDRIPQSLKKIGLKSTPKKDRKSFSQTNRKGSNKNLEIENQNVRAQNDCSENKPSQQKHQQEEKALKDKNFNILGDQPLFKGNAYPQTSASFEKKQYTEQYFTYQNYSFRKLSSEHRTAALKLLTLNFIENEPLAQSFYKQFPQQKGEAYQFWEEYWDMYMDDAIQGGISLAVVDLDNYQELIGVYTFKNYKYFPPNPLHNEKYLKGFTIVFAQVALQEQLIQKSPTQVQNVLLNSEMIAEAWAAAIKDQHTKKSLYSKMTALAQNVLRKAGFEYALVFASNFVSSKVLKKLQFTKISESDCEKFEFLGNRPFAQIETLHKNPSLWFKKLK